MAQRVAFSARAHRPFTACRQQERRALVAGAKHGGVGEVALEQLGAAAEVALVPVGQKEVAARPQRVVRRAGVGPCPVLHAEVAQRLAQVGRALAVRGQRVERLQVGQPGECLARCGHGRHGLAAVVAQHGLHLPGQRVARVSQACAVQCVQRCGALAQRVFGHRQPHLCAGVSRLDHQGLEQRGAGGLGIALPQRQQSGSRQGHVVVARLRQGGIQGGARLGKAQGFDGRRGGFAPVGRLVWRQGHGLRQCTAGRAQVSALLQCAAQPCQGGSPLRIPLRVGHCLPVQGQGGVTLPLQPVPVGVGLQQWRKAGRRGPRGVQPGARFWQAVQRHQQVGAARSGTGISRALPGQGQALLRGVRLAVQHLQVRQGQLDHGPTIPLRRQRLQQGTRLGPLPRAQCGAYLRQSGWRRLHGLELGPTRQVARVSGHPLHPLAGVDQQALDRRLAGLGHALLGGPQLHAAQVVAQLHSAGQHGERGPPRSIHLHVPVGTPHHGQRCRRLQLQVGRGLLGARPQPARGQFQQGARWLGLAQPQLRVGRHADLRAVCQQQCGG